MNVVLLTGDLIVSSRVAGTAPAGASIVTAATVGDAIAQCERLRPRLLIVDLSTPALDVAALVAAAKSTADCPPIILAFGPHVHERLLVDARQAGCDLVLSRGQFFARMDDILRSTVADQAEPAGG
jgi:CheY-like chemotaxis protein